MRNFENESTEYETNIKKLKASYWFDLNGYDFEIEVEKLLKLLGYDAKKTKGSGDGGIDIIIKDSKLGNILVQCKAHKKKEIGPSTVRELSGVIYSKRNKNEIINKGIIITLKGASYNARLEAQENNIDIWDVNNLIEMHDKYLDAYNKN